MHWLLFIPGIVVLAVAITVSQPPEITAICLLASSILIIAAFSFQYLRIVDEEGSLAVRYGPVPLFVKRIVYKDIQDVERARTSIIDGWGIHWIPCRGWTCNLWGFDCVRVTLNSGATLRIGTDDPDGLARFLNEKRLTKS
jgi:hypothetical protein